MPLLRRKTEKMEGIQKKEMRTVDSSKILDLVVTVEGTGYFVWIKDVYEVTC